MSNISTHFSIYPPKKSHASNVSRTWTKITGPSLVLVEPVGRLKQWLFQPLQSNLYLFMPEQVIWPILKYLYFLVSDGVLSSTPWKSSFRPKKSSGSSKPLKSLPSLHWHTDFPLSTNQEKRGRIVSSQELWKPWSQLLAPWRMYMCGSNAFNLSLLLALDHQGSPAHF